MGIGLLVSPKAGLCCKNKATRQGQELTHKDALACLGAHPLNKSIRRLANASVLLACLAVVTEKEKEFIQKSRVIMTLRS